MSLVLMLSYSDDAGACIILAAASQQARSTGISGGLASQISDHDGDFVLYWSTFIWR